MPDVTLFDVANLFEPERPLGSQPPNAPFPPPKEKTPWRGTSLCWSQNRTRTATGLQSPPEVEVRISKRRKKTSEAKWVGGRIVVSLPAHLDVESRLKTIDWLVEGLLTGDRLQFGLDDAGLLARAVDLSDRYLVGARPASVRWVTNQTACSGSCSYYSGHIRLSHRLRVVPEWVPTPSWCTRSHI